ncbi:T9SS type B sorting domain-containing protein [Winogradskyella endarachnes]|uniref:T9SS type B sorting domain-containing protein n=1 Tax=Winogradskyella endarachnes TaxID=2681965 RepID=A0A6L6U9F3_9FLAO|nr:T9SS type B sorting domain-containing protein [Winogradskyella endarachnes]MUU78116.1 T9SS type B sorting domain-containing protein [Winogradskyella endarachnes]
MKKKNIFLFLFSSMYILYSYAQQIVTDNTQTPNTLIQNLVGNSCATASNVSSGINGNLDGIISYGTFNNNGTNFPFLNGLILSTGSVNSAGNTLIASNLNEGSINWSSDADIENTTGITQTLNATSIEFDYSSINNFISFKYILASDEYQQEYPCEFKDVFVILIKPAGTSEPYVNIATVPDTSIEVSTNTIHPDINGFCDAQNETFFNDYNLGETNYNGRTEVLTATAEIIPNQTYHIKMVVADHIDQRFDTSVFIEADGFGNSVNLGPNQSICGADLTLNANIDNTLASYTWFLNGNEIIDENSATIEVTTSGNYEVLITIPTINNDCILYDSIEIEIIPFQEAAPITDITICDIAPGDGLYNFDFSLLKDQEILESLPSDNYFISYHISQDDAQTNSNPIIGSFQNTDVTHTIFARIESLDGDCLQIGSFDIFVYNSPNTYELTLDICNFMVSDLGLNDFFYIDFAVSNFEFYTTVSYYLTEEDAINMQNELSEMPSFENQAEAFYARVQSDLNPCASIVPIHLNYIPQPDIGRYIINSCLETNLTETIDGETYNYNTLPITYNVFDIFDELEEEFPGIEASLNTLIVGVPPLITTSENSLGIPISIRFIDENCPTYMTIEIHKNLLYNLLEKEKIITRCDDNSNDGLYDFNLSELKTELKDGFEIDLTFYATEEDRNASINALDENSVHTVANGNSIFIASSYEDCTHYSKITLHLNPGLNLQPLSMDYCGNINIETNTADITLPPIKDTFLLQQTITGPVELYNSLQDAENQENELVEIFEINGNQHLFYVRLTDIFTGCYDITTIQINVTNSLEVNDVEPLIICDDDQDLISTVNLEHIIPLLYNDSSQLTFSFFETFDNAVEDELKIENFNNYNTSSTKIFIRVEMTDLDCFNVIPYDILIYANPNLIPIPDFINCVVDPNLPSEFYFTEKDPQIIRNQQNMEVLYFETEDDALSNINAIDKESGYLPLSNPQTIFVRLQNINENSCFTIAPMLIEIRQAPIYNNPTDIFECDVNNNGLASTDLNEKIIEIIENSTTNLNVTFHLTPANAEAASNEIPLSFTATNNPQIIYTRIENIASGCFDVKPITVSTLSLPEVQFGQSLTACGDNYNFSPQWNLTEIELEVLDGRQYNIDFTYFESEADLIANTNAITNPQAYTNTSNPQTIFAKIRNATTECFDMVPFQLIVNSPPQINTFEAYEICENSENQVDLLEINDIILDDTFNVLISYYANELDAENKQNVLDTNYFYTSTTETLFARVEYSTTQCYATYPFQLLINALPIANQPDDLMVCDDDFDGYTQVDLTQQNNAILGNQNPNEYSVSFYNSESNAIENLQSLDENYIAFNNEIIFVRLENNVTGCYDITQFTVVINDIPNISIDDQVVCLNNLPLVVSAETSNSLDTYLWSTNATTSQIEITEIGSYWVTITNQLGCQNTSTFNVIESESAIINTIETIDFSDPNNITVTIEGAGDYLYQLNNGDAQVSNFFQNVPIGYNTVTIIDQNGCDQVTRTVLVIDAPKHLSPNDDGDFDTWHIAGVETLPGTIIKIFDRKGKLITQLNHDSLGWDGTYNGKKMPASDYWFTAVVQQNGKTFEIVGHFSLRR